MRCSGGCRVQAVNMILVILADVSWIGLLICLLRTVQLIRRSGTRTVDDVQAPLNHLLRPCMIFGFAGLFFSILYVVLRALS
jgi:hypothetical protein